MAKSDGGNLGNVTHELTPLNWRLAVDAGDIIPLSPGQFVAS